jgi:hypothetical protein
MRVKTTVAVLALTALALALPASAAAGGSRVIRVEPGESIQAAIDKAKPGTTIKLEEGKYVESVTVSKDDISIVGEGRKKTEIAVPPAADVPDGAGCVEEHNGQQAVSGICVFPEAEGQCENSPRVTGADAPPVIRAVEDVEVSKLAVTGFTGDGVIYFCADDLKVTRVLAEGAEGSAYGLAAFASKDMVFARNLALNGDEAGIYIGDSPDADATVWKNVTWNNGFGLFIRDAAHGKIEKNKAFGNCVGVLILNTDESQAPPEFQSPPIDAKDWLAKRNNVTANNRACPAGDEGDAASGVGIAVVSGIDVSLIDNGVFGNDSAAQSVAKGGIVVIGEPGFKPSTGTKVGFNTAHGNTTDLVWDEQGAGNKFFGNDCLTSQPDGLCEDPDENGDGEHGDDHDRGDRDHKGDKRGDGDRKHAKHKQGKKHKKHRRGDD